MILFLSCSEFYLEKRKELAEKVFEIEIPDRYLNSYDLTESDWQDLSIHIRFEYENPCFILIEEEVRKIRIQGEDPSNPVLIFKKMISDTEQAELKISRRSYSLEFRYTSI